MKYSIILGIIFLAIAAGAYFFLRGDATCVDICSQADCEKACKKLGYPEVFLFGSNQQCTCGGIAIS